MFKRKKVCSIVSVVTSALIATAAHGACFPLSGVVTSAPTEAGDCAGLSEEFLDLHVVPDTAVQFPAIPFTCFKIRGQGAPGVKFRGVSEFTSVVVAGVGPSGGVAATPLVFPVPEASRANLLGFSSQAVLSGKVGKLRGKILTKDTGYIAALDPDVTDVLQAEDQIVGQVLNIVGGEGDFEQAYGAIGVAGNELGGFAQFTGQICVPDRK